MVDLGNFDAPLLIFGGPYGNLEATEALLAEAARRGIPSSRIICTGDLVAYCADPQATVDLVRSAEIAVVRGNCEDSIGNDQDDCGCGFDEGTACDLLSLQWFAYARENVDESAKAWMRDLPDRITFEMADRRIAVVHGAASSINEFVFASSPDLIFEREIDLAGADAVIGGHCGLPFFRSVGRRLWLNAGAIGMPANDGTPRGWFTVLSSRENGFDIEIAPLAYDHAAAAEKLRVRGLAGGYADALETGLWPSQDVLPAAERARRGAANR